MGYLGCVGFEIVSCTSTAPRIGTEIYGRCMQTHVGIWALGISTVVGAILFIVVAHPHPPFSMAQPPPSRIGPRGLLTLPYRLCNPPPAVGKVCSCGVTPVLDVRLKDVLARQHLPPIGLKDLEEYLLYVEHSPENLYFILWLKDYTARHHAWAQHEKMALVSKKVKMTSATQCQNFSVPPTSDPSLAMFYLCMRQTFFTPNGEYKLNIPSDILAPFHCSPHAQALHTHSQDHSWSPLWHSQSVHPDPAVFTEVALEVWNMLNKSLKRCVRAAYTNMGSQRAVCGIIAGFVFTFIAGVLPLVLTTRRWNIGLHRHLIRLAALSGLWFGLTVLITSLQGICPMIYLFGDLRQLRKFELTRPTISWPMPMPILSFMPFRSTHSRGQSLLIPSGNAPVPNNSIGTVSQTSSPLNPPTSFVAPTRSYTQFANASLASISCKSCKSEVYSSVGYNEIDVLPAFFDDVPAPEGPATASCLHRSEYRPSLTSVAYLEPAHTRPEPRSSRMLIRTPAVGNPVLSQSMQSLRGSMKSPSEYGLTAGFIPNGYSNNSTTSLSDTTRPLHSQRSACYFDFDSLPPNRVGQHRDSSSGGDGVSLRVGCMNSSVPPSSSVVVADTSILDSSTPTSLPSPMFVGAGHLFRRAQYKCNQRMSPASKFSPPEPALSTDHRMKWFLFATLIPSFTAGVPAFATPLTQVQSPVVKRAQWKVVIRAAFVAVGIAGVLTGIVVGVVP